MCRSTFLCRKLWFTDVYISFTFVYTMYTMEIKGNIYDKNTNQPIEKALVYQRGINNPEATYTDVYGAFTIDYDTKGKQSIQVEHPNYKSSGFSATNNPTNIKGYLEPAVNIDYDSKTNRLQPTDEVVNEPKKVLEAKVIPIEKAMPKNKRKRDVTDVIIIVIIAIVVIVVIYMFYKLFSANKATQTPGLPTVNNRLQSVAESVNTVNKPVNTTPVVVKKRMI